MSEPERELHIQREMIIRDQEMTLGDVVDRLKHKCGDDTGGSHIEK